MTRDRLAALTRKADRADQYIAAYGMESVRARLACVVERRLRWAIDDWIADPVRLLVRRRPWVVVRTQFDTTTGENRTAHT